MLSRCLLLCLLGCGVTAGPARRARSADQWLSLVSEVARLGAQHSRDAATPLRPYLPPPINIEGAHGSTSLQLVLVPVPAPPARCELSEQAPAPAAKLVLPALQAAPLDPEPVYVEQHVVAKPVPHPSAAPPAPPAPRPSRPSAAAVRRARSAPHIPPVADSALLLQQFLAEKPSGWQDPTTPPIVLEPFTVEDELVPDDGSVSAEVTPAPSPEVPGQDTYSGNDINTDKCIRGCSVKSPPLYIRASPSPSPGDAPPPPRFERSMMLEAVLTVPRAQYSEPYTLWWDAASGAARTDYHGGAASSYRLVARGRLQALLLRTDRTGDTDVRRCLALPPRRLTLADRALPALPSLADFTFAGYVAVGGGAARVERWTRAVRGAPAGGDVLTYRHEALVARAADNHTCTPLRYAVRVDSALLGAGCDGYVHSFTRARLAPHEPALLQLAVGDACDTLDTTEHAHLVEPLREFSMLQLDPRYDAVLRDFKSLYDRRYADDLEEAIRKQNLIRSERFVSSGNREGATFELEVNYLGDRLEVERRKLLGATEEAGDPGDAFPHSAEELKALRNRLPQKFSWVERGGVTPVRSQYPCSTCWAFSVAGAVEGALFARSGRLVPLSEQALVDCGAPFGTHGCNGSWPSAAYDYVKHRGLPALDQYPYKGEVQQCGAPQVPVVTRISGHVAVTADSVLALKVALRRRGPAVVVIDGLTDTFASYAGGYYSDGKCKKNSLNHAVLAVGWKVHRGQTYFLVKNSWSAAWGEAGYVWLHGASNACGVLRRPSLPRLAAADVLSVPGDAPAAAPADASR